MAGKVVIYGKAGWPYTSQAREAFKDHDYVDVKLDSGKMEEMLKLSKGQRKVPVIVQGGDVTVGFGGRSW